MTEFTQELVRKVRALPASELEEFLDSIADIDRPFDPDASSSPTDRLRVLIEEAEQDIAAGRVRPLDEVLHNR